MSNSVSHAVSTLDLYHPSGRCPSGSRVDAACDADFDM